MPAHAERDRLLALFHAAAIIPVVSTNGGEPTADIQVGKSPQHGAIEGAWLTERGRSRLRAAGADV